MKSYKPLSFQSKILRKKMVSLSSTQSHPSKRSFLVQSQSFLNAPQADIFKANKGTFPDTDSVQALTTERDFCSLDAPNTAESSALITRMSE